MKYQLLAICTLLGLSTVIALDSSRPIGTDIDVEKSNQTFNLTENQKNNQSSNEPSNKTSTSTDILKLTKEQYEKAKRLLPSDCGHDLSNRIIGGNVTELDEFPWMALLVYSNGTTVAPICGGSLINKRYVLTAAHCIKNSPSWVLQVRLGEYDTSTKRDCITYGVDDVMCADDPITVGVEEKLIYSEFDLMINDIALLRLSRDVNFTDYIKPICLPAGTKVNANVTSAGWGATNDKYNSLSNVKLKITLPVVPHNKCYEQKWISLLVRSYICAGGQKHQDTCYGDSGGPLMQQSLRPGDNVYRWEAVGITSFGTNKDCGLLDWPTIYTDVSYYMPWILKMIRE